MLLYNNGTDVVVAFNRVVANVVGNLTGTASNATVLQTARTIAISGNVTGTATSFDGSANISIDATAVNADGITSGTLAVARGGTGATTLTDNNVILGNGTSAVKFVAPGTDGNVLTSNGTAWVSEAISAGGNYIARFFTSSTTWTKPAGLKAVKVTVVGAGGNGGANIGPGTYNAGGNGGGGGGAIEYLAAPSIPGPVTVTVGTAPSKTSSFGPFLSATGGTNGATPGSAPTPAPQGPYAGGSGSGGNINVFGQDGQGVGGGSGGSGNGAFCFGPGRYGSRQAGRSFGGGGTGKSGAPSGTGGAGAAGIVIVEEFY
jgi:hypothetical protein